MTYSERGKIGRIITVRLDYGERVLESIQKVIDEAGIVNGAVVSGIGTTSTAHYHRISKTDPEDSGDTFYTYEGPAEVSSVDGLIVGGKPHLHFTFSGKDSVQAVHLEPDTVTAYLMELLILELVDYDYHR